LVDSVTMELSRRGYGIDLVIHPVLRVRRDSEGRLTEVLEPGNGAQGALAESVIHAEVIRQPDREQRLELGDAIERVLEQVSAAVGDWQAMRGAALTLAGELSEHPPPVEEDERREAESFLRWLTDDHFTFLGYREYELVSDGEQAGLKAVPGSGLGILQGAPVTPYTKLQEKAVALARAPHVLVLTKANSRSTVHRPAYLDYIGVKKYGSDGEVIGERRFLGLYTTAAYKASAGEIPIVRGKVHSVLARAGFPADSHDAKALLEILESYPRDSLFQIETEQLFEIAIGILGLGERQRVRLFVRRDQLDRFISCLVCIPRDRFNTENRERVGRILAEAFGGTQVDWSLHLTESVLVRVYYIVHCDGDGPADYDVAEIEARVVEATRDWSDDLRLALIDELGEERAARLHARYRSAFPPAYRADWVARSAVLDIARLEELGSSGEPIISLYRPPEAPEDAVRCKLFSTAGVSLSDVLPTFEHMGAKVVDERPYEVNPRDSEPIWIYDFGLRCGAEDVERVRDAFQDAFLGVWRGELENDGLNGLVLRAGLTGAEIAIIRALAKYLRQAAVAFSDAYMERTLLAHPGIAVLLVRLFFARFEPGGHGAEAGKRLQRELEQAIDAVESLDEDRILRAFLSVLRATLRTNYFRRDEHGAPRKYLSFKLDPSELSILPLPRPRFEIFVYSPRVEGVHLRGGKVARGGLRW
ncbi:MAG: NAD-glutamate dehydrogenase, partial [Solirubrobacterales bacterium]|nr:NAD-glutamate dehydrogenase [Solirubrobacterales bacterium]